MIDDVFDMAKKKITDLQQNGGFASGSTKGATYGTALGVVGTGLYAAFLATHPFCFVCATTYAGATAATGATSGLLGGLLGMDSQDNKIKKAEIELKKEISSFVKNILNNNVAQAQDIDIWQTLCASTKLPCLPKNDKDKIIKNVPIVKQVLEALVNNENMDNLLPEHYQTVKSKIERLGGTEKVELLTKFDNKFSVKTTQKINKL